MSETASEIAGLRAALAASEARAESALAQVRAVVSTSEAMIKHLRLEIAKLWREQYGRSSERRARLIDQMELQLEELEAAATEDELVAEMVTRTTPVAGVQRRRPVRKPFPEHLPRERVVIEAPTTCTCCGSDRIVKMGEDVTDTLERHSAAVEGGPDGAREVHLPPLREDLAGSGTVPSHFTRLGRAEPFGDDPLREVRPASAPEPTGRALCAGRRRTQPVDPGRPGRRLCRRARACSFVDP